MSNNIEFSAQAFSKMSMHAMKYAHSLCAGLLLSAKGTEEDNLSIVEAIPVSHASKCLAPNLEIAYNAIKKYADKQDLQICGYYQTESVTEDAFCQKIGEKIVESFPKAVMCYLNFGKQVTLEPYQYVEGKWRRKQYNVETDSELIVDNILFSKEKLYRRIVDFDDHFDNIDLDWTNAILGEKIDKLMTEVC